MDEFSGFNKAAIAPPTVSSSGGRSGGSGGRGGGRGRLAQVEVESSSVSWTATYAKSFMLKVKPDNEGVVPEGYSLKTARSAGSFDYEETSVELVTEYNVCVDNTEATQIYAKIMVPVTPAE